MTLKERFLSLCGGPVVYYIWLWRFLIVFDTSPSRRVWGIESITLYNKRQEEPVFTLYQKAIRS